MRFLTAPYAGPVKVWMAYVIVGILCAAVVAWCESR